MRVQFYSALAVAAFLASESDAVTVKRVLGEEHGLEEMPAYFLEKPQNLVQVL